jgi:predicted molibdopterin-dependent oxidoreductase YjgC
MKTSLHEEPNGKTITLMIDGLPVLANKGDTIASALMATGRRAWRLTRKGGQRGLFCGIGQCFDCLVMVDGVPGTRACMTLVIAGMVVDTRSNPEVAS